jgi:hypothetical protein
LAHVDKSGEMKDRCGEMAVVLPVAKRREDGLLGYANFFSRAQKKMFTLAAIHLDGNLQKNEKEGPQYFKSIDSTFPVIVAAGMRTSIYGSAGGELKKMNFKPALTSRVAKSKKGKGDRTLSDNIWVRSAVVGRALPIHLFDRFPEIKPKEIDASVASSFPVIAEVALVPEPDENLMNIIAKAKRESTTIKSNPKAAPKANPASAAKQKESFHHPREDLEAETLDAESEIQARPVKNPGAKKSIKNRPASSP